MVYNSLQESRAVAENPRDATVNFHRHGAGAAAKMSVKAAILGLDDRTGNSAIRSADPENPTLERNMN